MSASRGREQVTIYTDDKVALRHAVTRYRQAMNASDLTSTETQPERRNYDKLTDHINRVRTEAQRFAAQQLERFRRWMASHEQHYAR